MKNYFIKHDGKSIQIILGDNFKKIINDSGEKVIAGYKGRKYIEYNQADFLSLSTTNDKYKYIGVHENYKFINGKPQLKTQSELDYKDEQAVKVNLKKSLKIQRENALNSITVEVNGKVFQSRRSDEMNFRLVIASMEDDDTEEWILDDDSIVEVTKAELEQAYMLGLAEGKRIFAEYKEAVKNL